MFYSSGGGGGEGWFSCGMCRLIIVSENMERVIIHYLSGMQHVSTGAVHLRQAESISSDNNLAGMRREGRGGGGGALDALDLCSCRQLKKQRKLLLIVVLNNHKLI